MEDFNKREWQIQRDREKKRLKHVWEPNRQQNGLQQGEQDKDVGKSQIVQDHVKESEFSSKRMKSHRRV